MASFKSTYFANLVLNATFNNAAFDATIPATIYAVAFTVAPTAAGGGTQATVVPRVAMACNTTNFPTATAATLSNAVAIAFGNATGNATIVGCGWFDAAAGGNMLDYGDFDTPKAALTGVAFTVPIGGFVGTDA